MGNIPLIHLPNQFNMDHFRKFAYLYTELIYQNNVEQYADMFVYTNGNRNEEVKMLNFDDNTKCYIRTTDLKIVHDIWSRLSKDGFDGFTKAEMLYLNKINKTLQAYIEHHTPYSAQYDAFGTLALEIFSVGIKLMPPNIHCYMPSA